MTRSDLPCLVIVVERGPAGVSVQIPADRATLQDLLLEIYRAEAARTIDLDSAGPQDGAGPSPLS